MITPTSPWNFSPQKKKEIPSFTVSLSLSPFPSLSAPCCQRSFLKVHVRIGGRRWRGGNGRESYVWRCVCACVCACQWGTGALAVSEKTAGSIWGRLIGQLGTVSMWHAAVNLLSLFSVCPFLSFTPILKCPSLYHYPICLFQYLFPFFFLPFNLFSLPHLPIVYLTFCSPTESLQSKLLLCLIYWTPCCSFVISLCLFTICTSLIQLNHLTNGRNEALMPTVTQEQIHYVPCIYGATWKHNTIIWTMHVRTWTVRVHSKYVVSLGSIGILHCSWEDYLLLMVQNMESFKNQFYI